MRSGTLATVHQIVGMGSAFRVAREDFEKDHAHIIVALRKRLVDWHHGYGRNLYQW